MDSISEILQAVKEGKISVKKAEGLLKLNALAVLGDFARLDYNRFLRRGVPEIIYAQNKTVSQINSIVKRLAKIKLESGEVNMPIILSRVTDEQIKPVLDDFSNSNLFSTSLQIRYFADARIIAILDKDPGKTQTGRKGKVALLAAGTSDIPALNESEVVLGLLGSRTIRFNDVGVAGLHRLIDPMRRLQEFDPDVVVVAAGMEGGSTFCSGWPNQRTCYWPANIRGIWLRKEWGSGVDEHASGLLSRSQRSKHRFWSRCGSSCLAHSE